jgi:hypothetical protein
MIKEQGCVVTLCVVLIGPPILFVVGYVVWMLATLFGTMAILVVRYCVGLQADFTGTEFEAFFGWGRFLSAVIVTLFVIAAKIDERR